MQKAASTETARRLKVGPLVAASLLMPAASWAADPSPSPRVAALLKQMTLEEKLSLIHGAQEPASTDQGQAGYWPGLARLRIPPFRLADGPPGVLTRRPATAPPAVMGLAATFSPADADAVGGVIARTAKALGQQVVLEPFINIQRDSSERNDSTFGEDPLLAGQIAGGMIRGIQAQGVMAQAKHFIGYDGASDVTIGGQALREIYIEPFDFAIRAGVSSLMCAYNKINGSYACGSSATLKDVLRKELGFKGFVTSDWGAIHGSDFVAKGTDLEMPGTNLMDTYYAAQPIPKVGGVNGGIPVRVYLPEEPGAPLRTRGGPNTGQTGRPVVTGMLDTLKSGAVKESDIDLAVTNILYEVERFGWLDHAPSLAQSPDPAAAAAPVLLKAAEDAAVLLKNDGILPLKGADLGSVALIGPGAGQLIAVGGANERSLGHVERQVSPLAALKAAAGPAAKFSFAVDNDMDGVPIPASAFSHDGAPGLARAAGGLDSNLDHTIKAGTALKAGSTGEWNGTLTVPKDGKYRLHLQVIGGGATFELDGKPASASAALDLHGNILQPGQDNILPTSDGLDNVRIERELTAGPHQIKVTLKGDDSGSPTQVRLAWVTPDQRDANRKAALAAAKAAKTAVVFAWGRNNPTFHLPGDQDKLIEDVAAANPNTIVVLNINQPVAMPWLSKVKGVVLMWFPGDEGGQATADVLLGKANPGGRLPFTWPVKLADNVANDPAHPERSLLGLDGKTTYSEGIMVGYRWFDSQNIEPAFPFGYGLSYTRFAYSGLKAAPGKGAAKTASVTVKNVGGEDGDEVVQFYLEAPAKIPADGQIAPKALVGFQRVHLKAGEARTVTVDLPARRFQYWSDSQKGWVRIPGARGLAVGGSSRDIKATTTVD